MSDRSAASSSAFLVAVAVVVAGCSAHHDAPSAGSCLPTCAGTRDYDALGYALKGRFDWPAQLLVASEEITLALSAGASPVVALDSEVTVTSVHGGGRTLTYVAAAGQLRVDLGPLQPGSAPVTFTVEYTAPTSDALVAALPRVDDPVRSRVVYTDSEPRRGHQWLVEKDDPADRALFSVDLTVDAGEDVVANGERIVDEPAPGGRRVAYAIDVPIPTYLMAFAAGQLQHTDRPTGSSVPLSLWYRSGLALDPGDSLGQLASAMSSFEALLGPYPFRRYSLVLLPAFPGGMENASITFEGEQWSQGPYNFGLHAHELAHHWLGDQVTMHGYDDVWVKEGMATLLAVEATRPWSDVEGRGRLMADSFGFNSGDAIVDPTLTGLDKYTSGPYERAAALITQIRALVGEAAFWARLRGFLAAHDMGSATGEQFVRAFAPELTEPEIQQVLGILPQVALPGFAAELLTGGATDQVRFTLTDPTHLVLAPYYITLVDSAGAATVQALTPGAPLVVDLPAGGYLAPDEREAWPDYPVTSPIFDVVTSSLKPDAGSTPFSQFLSRSAAHQERTQNWAGLPGLVAADFPAYYAALDSDLAAEDALALACSQLQSLSPTDQTTWRASLTPILDAPRSAVPSWRHGYCGPLLGAAFLAELQALADGATALQLGRLEYLLWFDYGADGFAPLSQVVTTSPSLKLRDQAMWRLADQTRPGPYTAVPVDQVAAWSAFFRARLAAADSYARVRSTWYGVVGLQDATALAVAGAALQRVSLPAYYQEQLVCGANALASGTPGAWATFQVAAQPWNRLSAGAASLLANPAGCASIYYSIEPRQPPTARLAAGASAAPAVGARPRFHELEGKGTRNRE